MWRHAFLSLAGSLLLSAACSSGTTSSALDSGGGPEVETAGFSASGASAQVPAAGSATAGASGTAEQAGTASVSGGAAGASSNGGSNAVGGNAAGGRSNASGGSSGSGGKAGNGGSAGAGSAACPAAGHITYTLAKSASPTTTEQAAYDRITTAMDKAISYYDCYTNITKSLNVSYVPSVSTADGNINGSVRFGSDTTYMDYRTAMHEIAHTVGVGQAANWGSFLSGGLFTGTHAEAQLHAINATLSTPLYPDVHADTQHFWPYGINQQSEVKSEADLIAHCEMVVAIRQDLGL